LLSSSCLHFCLHKSSLHHFVLKAASSDPHQSPADLLASSAYSSALFQLGPQLASYVLFMQSLVLKYTLSLSSLSQEARTFSLLHTEVIPYINILQTLQRTHCAVSTQRCQDIFSISPFSHSMDVNSSSYLTQSIEKVK
jgi:hypothetical protein